jgi:hypothetical protein
MTAPYGPEVDAGWEYGPDAVRWRPGTDGTPGEALKPVCPGERLRRRIEQIQWGPPVDEETFDIFP